MSEHNTVMKSSKELYTNASVIIGGAICTVLMANNTLAKLLLMNLIYTENLHRFGGYYGNEAMGTDLMLRTRYFLPEEEDEIGK